MSSILIKEARIINEGRIIEGDVFVRDGFIEAVGSSLDVDAHIEIGAKGRLLLPGLIDDQVHFREPGLTHKADIHSESRAAVAGGVTSFMEMPNVSPPTLTQELLEDKYQRAARHSPANYSFYMGASNDNLEEVLKTDPRRVCGIKAFMGSSTGNMLVDDETTLDRLFAQAPMLIATHCEDEKTVRANERAARERYGEDVPVSEHPHIRSVEACLRSSSLAVELARRHGTRLHILHITTRDELDLFRNDIPLAEKRITSEACVHHLYFNSDSNETLGARIKCNPAIKGEEHRASLLPAVLDDRIDVIATDHAPHLLSEKANTYFKSPSGLPLVQHTLMIMLELHRRGEISLEKIVEKMCHAPADCFQIDRRGYIREGYWADLVLVNPDEEWTVGPDNILYKCGWSPFEGHRFRGRVAATIVSGHLAYHHGSFDENKMGERLEFQR